MNSISFCIFYVLMNQPDTLNARMLLLFTVVMFDR